MKTSRTQTSNKNNPTKTQTSFTETFRLFDRSLKTLLKGSKYLGFGTTGPPSFPANIAERQKIFILGPKRCFFFFPLMLQRWRMEKTMHYFWDKKCFHPVEKSLSTQACYRHNLCSQVCSWHLLQPTQREHHERKDIKSEISSAF